MTISNILIVGCGKMGGALLAAWQRSIDGVQFHVVEPEHYHGSGERVTWHKHLDQLPADLVPQVIVFAIKPQQMPDTLPQYRTRFAASNPLYISIAAGRDLAFLSSQLGAHAHIVRAMPNTPALVQQGVTALCAAPTLSEASKRIATELMQAVGSAHWLQEEAQMDAVTAVSGSGPAYVFYFLECLTKAAIDAGLPSDLAKKLALETVSGACALARNSSESYEVLRRNVTSPGGTTEAGLRHLMAPGALETLLLETVNAAKKRSEELK